MPRIRCKARARHDARRKLTRRLPLGLLSSVMFMPGVALAVRRKCTILTGCEPGAIDRLVSSGAFDPDDCLCLFVKPIGGARRMAWLATVG